MPVWVALAELAHSTPGPRGLVGEGGFYKWHSMKSIICTIGFYFLWVGLLAQSVRGTVQSSRGEALIGISISLEGTGIGTVTDANGNFRLGRVKPGTYVLLVSGVSYQARKEHVVVEAGKPTLLNLQLNEASHLLSEVTVKAIRSSRYWQPNTTVATRTNAALLDIPQSVQSVPLQLMRDQQAVTLNDITKNMAGVTTYAPYSYYVLRGFSTNYDMSNFTTNGVKGSFYDFSQQPLLYNVQSVEVVKGPASALFSAGAPGGIINISTRQPQDLPSVEISAGYASYNQYRVSADATGPLDKKKKLLYRFIAGTQNSNSFRDHVKGQNLFLAPSLTYLFSPLTRLSAEFNYQYDNTNIAYDRGIVALQNTDGSFNFNAVPLSWSRHSPKDTGRRVNFSAQVNFQHSFNSRVSFTSLDRYAQYSLTDNQYDNLGYGPPVNDSLVDMIFEVYPVKYYAFSSYNYITIKAGTGPLAHSIVAGVDYNMYKNPTQYYQYAASNLSILNPETLQLKTDYNTVYYSQNARDLNQSLAFYVQDQVDFSDKLKALLAMRYDSYNFVLDYNIPVTSPTEHSVTRASALLPRVGLLYKPVPAISIYGSYCQSFNPNFANYANGGQYAPEKGSQVEFGVKYDLVKDKLSSTLAVYQIDKTNVLEPDPRDPTGLSQVVAGGARSRGLEVNVQGNISPSLSIVANYAYNEAHITRDTVNPSNVGNQLPCAAPNLANMWLKYNFRGVVRGLGLGAGVRFEDRRAVSVPNGDLKIPAYTSFQASVNYQLRKMNIQFNAYNIGNTRNFTGGYSQTQLFTEAPRTFRIGATYTL